MKLNEEQLRFFYNEVMELLEWDDEDEAAGKDPLEFAREVVRNLRRDNRRLRARVYGEVLGVLE